MPDFHAIIAGDRVSIGDPRQSIVVIGQNVGKDLAFDAGLLKKISGIGGYHDCLLQNVGSRSRVIWSGEEELQCTFQAIWRPDTTPAGMGVIFSDIESIFTAAYGNL